MSEKEIETLERVAEILHRIQTFSRPISNWQELERDDLRLDAILMNFVNLGECVSRFSEPFHSLHPEIEWGKIKGLRNIVAHDYWGVDVEMVWEIMRDNVPKLASQITKLLAPSHRI